MIETRFRKDYLGEFVITETKWSGGKKEQIREWIANPIENYHISSRAVCIASRNNIERFDYTILERHRGGLLSSKKVQTYGIGSIAEDLKLDFIVETNSTELEKISSKQYQESNIVYTSARNCTNNPGKFYLIPYSPRLTDTATIIYLAAFDGHQEIFLIGYNKETPPTILNWELYVKQVFDAYKDVKFYLVGEKTNMFDCWLECDNVNTLTEREFVTYADV